MLRWGDLRDALRGNGVPATVRKMNSKCTNMKGVPVSPDATIDELDNLLDELRKASAMRNVLCHGSWGLPDNTGASIPFFVNRQKMIFESAIDCKFMDQVQMHAADLACTLINTVTHMGWKFPGSSGPGKAIWNTKT